LTHAGKVRKRYILLVSCEGTAPTEETRRLLAEFVRERHPETRRDKSVILVSGGIIIRSDQKRIDQLRMELQSFEAAGVKLRSASVSGSISKLKRLAER